MSSLACKKCGGDDLEVLGSLGHRIVYQCRNCGLQFTKKIEEEAV